MAKLILLRHGQSVWNKKNLFTGWVDIPLSEQGVKESVEAGKKLAHLPIDAVFTSTLVRSHMTLALALLQHESQKVPVFIHEGAGKLAEWSRIYSKETLSEVLPVTTAWELNERMYGELQGLNKEETAQKFGKEQVHLWRRSFDVPPPGGESLSMTAKRTIPYFQQMICPRLSLGENIFVCAHGNSLRSIIMHLDALSPEEVLKLELATGEFVIYDFQGTEYERLSR